MSILKNYEDIVSMSLAQTRKLFGGKALGLLEAHQLGLPVPNAYFLGADHYETFTRQHPHIEHFKSNAHAFLNEHLAQELATLPDTLYPPDTMNRALRIMREIPDFQYIVE